MSYRIYLPTTDGGTYEKAEIGARSFAEGLFKAFLDRDEIEGTPVSLHLVHVRAALAVYRFDVAAGSADNWRGRENETAWADGTGQVRRPAELEGGERKNVYLNTTSIAKARKLRKRNISVGIRIALSRVYLNPRRDQCIKTRCSRNSNRSRSTRTCKSPVPFFQFLPQ